MTFIFNLKIGIKQWSYKHNGETDEANYSWLHPIWPPPKRPGQDSTSCVVTRTSTELIFCMQGVFYVRNYVYKPHRLVCECCQDICTWKSWVMKPTALGMKPSVGVHLRRIKPTEHWWSQLDICDELQSIAFGCLLAYTIWLYINDIIITILPLKYPLLVVLWKAIVLLDDNKKK